MKLNCKKTRKNHFRIFKKAQLTLMMIVGIIMLLSATAFFVIRQQTIETRLETEIFKKQAVSGEFTPVIDYVENCIKDVAAEGLIILGERGGFIDPLASGFTAGSDSTESSGVRLAPDWVIPYWYYMASANDQDSFAFITIPEKSLSIKKGDASISIEGQLENYLSSRIGECINFESLERQGFAITSGSDAAAQVVVADEDIVFAINYPLKIEKESAAEISQFFVRIPININTIFELATLMTYVDREFHILENHALNIITAYSGTDKLIPPMSATEITLEPKTWVNTEVEKRIKEALQINIPSLTVSGTANHRTVSSTNQLMDDIYNKGMFISADESVYEPIHGSFSDLSVNFDYLPAELYFDSNCDPLCKPESASANWLSLIGIQRYNTIYDLSFPVKIEIAMPVENKALFPNGFYSFNFMLEANIRSNEPVNSSTVLIAPLITGPSSITFNENQRTSADMTIIVKDSMTDEEIDDVNIMFTCVDETGYIGKTQNKEYVGKFPVCLGGIITFAKEGYLQKSLALSTFDEKKTVRTLLNKKVKRNITVKKAMMKKVGSIFVRVTDTFANPIPLGDNESATVMLTREGTQNEETYVEFAEFNGQDVSLELAPGTYQLDLRLFHDEELAIPDREIEGETISGTTIDPGFIGGGSVCEIEISPEDLDKASRITFNLVSIDLPGIPLAQRQMNDLGEIAKIDEEYAQYCYALSPRFE